MALSKVILDKINQEIADAQDRAEALKIAFIRLALFRALEEQNKSIDTIEEFDDIFNGLSDYKKEKLFSLSLSSAKESKNDPYQLTQRERALVERMLKDINEISDEHDKEMRSFLKPPISPEADDVLNGKTNIRDVKDETVVLRYKENMSLLRPQPTSTLAVENEEELISAPASRKAPEATIGNALRLRNEERFMLAAALLSQNFTAQEIVALNRRFTQFADNVSNSLNQSMTDNGVSADRRTLLLTHVVADLLNSPKFAATENPTDLPQYETHKQVGDAGLAQTGSNLPKPQFTGGGTKELDPAQLPVMEPSKTLRRS